MSSINQALRLDKKIARLGLPILIGQLGTIVVGFADTAMVGHYGTAELAAAAFVNNVFNMAVFALLGFSYGMTPLAGALFGAERRCDTGRLARSAIAVNLGFALLVTLLMGVVYLNLHRLGQPEELLPIIRPYFAIYLAGLLPLALFNVMAQWAYAINRTAMPMWIVLFSNVVNIIGNYVLIYGHFGFPELGLSGAGISTLTARLLCAAGISCVFLFGHGYSDYRRGVREGHVNSADCKKVTVTSIPVALQMAFESGSFSVAGIMAGWLGALQLASFQVLVIMGTLGFCVYYSIGAATSVVVSNALGTGNRPLMRRSAFAGYRIILVFALIASLIFTFLARQIFEVFSPDGAVIAMSLTLIVPLVVYQLGDATQIAFANALRGTQVVMPMLWISFVSYMVVGIPVCYMLAFTCGLGLYGIILSFSVSLFLAGALFLRYFLKVTKN